MPCLRFAIWIFVLILFNVAWPAAGRAMDASRILVAYNANWTGDQDVDGVQDSLQVAQYYQAKRGIPAANLIGLPITITTTYYYTGEYAKFQAEMVQPLQGKLAALGPTAMDVILLVYGLPLTVQDATGSPVAIDNVLMALNYWNATTPNFDWYSYRHANPYLEVAPTFGTDKAHFDHATYKYGGTEMYLVTRLDGPKGLWGSMELVDQARYGDTYVGTAAGAYKGYAYVDSRYGQGGTTRYTDAYLAAATEVQTGSYSAYAAGDKNMAFAEHYILASGLDLKWENTTNSYEIGEAGAEYHDLTSGLTAPRALLYGGWYNFGRYLDVWEWLPGSVACDLNSNSLSSLRTASSGVFGTSALSKGATAFCGVVSEPYLIGHPRPNVLIYYLLQGYCFAEAAGLCTPTVGWMPMNVGDPLYAPFASKAPVLDTQAPALAAGYPQVAFSTTGNPMVTAWVADAPQPEVVRMRMEYGITTAYDHQAVSPAGYWRRHRYVLEGLESSTTYHYRLVMEDPVGNITVTGDYTFTTGTVLTPTATRTATVTRTVTPTPTASPFLSQTSTPTATASPTSATPSATRTITRTRTVTPVVSPTPTKTASTTITITATITATQTHSPTPSASTTRSPLPVAAVILYPNPARRSVWIAWPLESLAEVQVSIYNTHGELVSRAGLQTPAENVFQLNVAALAPGVYFARVRLLAADGRRTEQFRKLAIVR